MSKKIDKETVKKIAGLAKMEIKESELGKYADQLSSILGYVEKLNEIDVEDAGYKSHVDMKNVMREDIAGNAINNDEAVSQARNKNGYFVVPAVI